MKQNLTKDNILLVSIKAYHNTSSVSVDEFYKDLKIIKYIKVLFKKVKDNKDVNFRILLNHFITLSNVFPTDDFSRIMFYYFEKKYWPQITPFLLFLNRMPSVVENINGENIRMDSIKLDEKIVRCLREIAK